MLAHNLKGILSIVPEALGMVKEANLEEDFPVNSADSASASYLRIHYLTKVAGKIVDESTYNMVTKAATLYGVKDVLDPMISKFSSLDKSASSISPVPVTVAEAGFEGDLSGFSFLNIEKTAEAAEMLYDIYGEAITSPQVLRYSGHAFLDKQAAIQSLSNRYYASKNPDFVKLARSVLDEINPADFKAVKGVCEKVTLMDKKAGLDIIGFNFYKEALFTSKQDFIKSASVILAGEEVPMEKVISFGKDGIASTLGKDVADGMTDCPVHNKAVLESLPRDLQIMLKSVLRGV